MAAPRPSLRSNENILFVHYADLLGDLAGEVRRIARFLEIEVPDDAWPVIVRNCSFAEMKAKGEWFAPNGGVPFKGGAQSSFHKGTNGRWREILSAEELALMTPPLAASSAQTAASGWNTAHVPPRTSKRNAATSI